MKIFYNPKAIATVIAIRDVLNLENTTIFFDNKRAREMIVNHRGEQLIFKEHKNGLYYCDLKLIINKIKEGCSALQTVK